MTSRNRVVVVGTVVGVHGLKGEVKVAPANGDPERFARVKSVLVEAPAHRWAGSGRRADTPGRSDASYREVAIERQWSQAGKGLAVLKLAGTDDPDAAERLRGMELFLPEEELPALEDGEYYSFMLVGMECLDETGKLLGRVLEVLDRPANDVIVVEAADGGSEYLIPAVEEHVAHVDLVARRIVIRNRPGLR